MRKNESLKNRFGTRLKRFYFDTLLPILDDAASQLSPWDTKLLVPTAVQSTAYYHQHIDQNRW